ncbi:hypothetical protein [Kitasatospora cheerisanensis]|uniref:Uncharacterized protein n=1 Tax=Kitasatospora cheerisanensis KCTC 2395 TaxID=1348663 RepID=A0A066YYV9_9ACTN|nr:hypothetical protein [Kitasatospora cheerisanensis]KDN86698.1 hypothetical protein KCH_15420 [Kitasatospora cheerisanensis KCTC 2395]
MQTSTRASALRAAIEAAVDTVATVQVYPWRTRISIDLPAPGHPGWPALLAALRQADRWGHLHQMAGSTVWADITSTDNTGDDDDD